MCFNEAIIDVLGYYGKKGVASFKANQKWNVNHHFLERDDFDEFIEAWDEVMHLCPEAPSFRNYLPAGGILDADLRAYLDGLAAFARAQGKRPAFCEIHSRGRAGGLRAAMGGFHIAQYRDPLSQFGSFLRPLVEAGQWNFLIFPLMELTTSAVHPLYALVPEQWRLPPRPWPANDAACRWSSSVEVISTAASCDEAAPARLYRWHLFSWFLSNLAALSYSDLSLNLDRAYEDEAYRASIGLALRDELGTEPDFSNLERFARYIRFEGIDMEGVAAEVIAAIDTSLQDGRLERALADLAPIRPTVSAGVAVNELVETAQRSLMSLRHAHDASVISVADWHGIVKKNSMIWFDPRLRGIARTVYPVVAPIVRAGRRVGVWR